jgi:hypothetical protein
MVFDKQTDITIKQDRYVLHWVSFGCINELHRDFGFKAF